MVERLKNKEFEIYTSVSYFINRDKLKNNKTKKINKSDDLNNKRWCHIISEHITSYDLNNNLLVCEVIALLKEK